jgi:hypothetical protein
VVFNCGLECGVNNGAMAMWLIRTLSIVAVLNAGLCGVRAQLNDGTFTSPIKTYEVLRADRLVLTVKNKPGAIISTATPPANGSPVAHPFLSATAHAATEENTLHTILVQSSDFDDFLRRLARRGYTIRERASN